MAKLAWTAEACSLDLPRKRRGIPARLAVHNDWRQHVQTKLGAVKVGKRHWLIGEDVTRRFARVIDRVLRARHGKEFTVRVGPELNNGHLAQIRLAAKQKQAAAAVHGELDPFVVGRSNRQ